MLKKINTMNVRLDFLKRKRCKKMVNKRHNRLRECEGLNGREGEEKQTVRNNCVYNIDSYKHVKKANT